MTISKSANPTTRRPDPYPAFCFGLSIPDIRIDHPVAFFKSVSGLKSETEVTDYREGGINGTTRRLVGATKWPNLVLKRGFAGNAWELLAWRYSWLDDWRAPIVLQDQRQQPPRTFKPMQRMQGSIYQLDRNYSIVCEWKFHRAWPCKWDGPDYDASKSELAIETLEIAHEGLTFAAYENGRPQRTLGTVPEKLPDAPPPCSLCPDGHHWPPDEDEPQPAKERRHRHGHRRH